MSFNILNTKQLMVMAILISGQLPANVLAAEETIKVAFPDQFKIRIGSYFVDQATTDITVLSNAGIGGGISFKDDLGGEDSDTIPRIDAYYRFNNKHRIDFTSFIVDRPGRKTISADFTIGDTNYSANDTLVSDIKYSVYKLGYAYSFYHSPEVELSLTAGLNLTSYDISYRLESGTNADANDVTAPLPMFGLRMAYAINPRWSIQYVSETFFIEVDDSIKGALLNYELNLEYKLFKHFALGAGVARIATDVEVKDDDWKGEINDSHRGFLLYGAFNF